MLPHGSALLPLRSCAKVSNAPSAPKTVAALMEQLATGAVASVETLTLTLCDTSVAMRSSSLDERTRTVQDSNSTPLRVAALLLPPAVLLPLLLLLLLPFMPLLSSRNWRSNDS